LLITPLAKLEIFSAPIHLFFNRLLGTAIDQFQKKNGRYPSNLSELGIPVPICPSASSGRSRVNPNYLWDENDGVITEGQLNHDKNRLGLKHAKGVRHKLSIQNGLKLETQEYR
jgi:hypothetical protein